jgi:hypothetical protein
VCCKVVIVSARLVDNRPRRLGYLRILQWAYRWDARRETRGDYHDDLMETAAANGHVDVLAWLLDQNKHVDNEWVVPAARAGLKNFILNRAEVLDYTEVFRTRMIAAALERQ